VQGRIAPVLGKGEMIVRRDGLAADDDHRVVDKGLADGGEVVSVSDIRPGDLGAPVAGEG